MTEKPSLSIVVGTCNRLASLKVLLTSLIGRIETDHRIIIVDAGSTDGTLEYLKGLTGIELVEDGRPIGQAKSLNRVFHRIETKYTCWLSDDNEATPGALDSAVAVMEQRPGIGMIGLKVKDVIGPRANLDYIGGVSPLGALTCNQGLFRTAAGRELGFFDEEYVNYGIDTDLTMNMLASGRKVALTRRTAVIHHRDHGTAPGAIANDQRRLRMDAALERYVAKYQGIRPGLRPKSLLRRRMEQRAARIIRKADYYGGRLGLPLERLTGFNARDWNNLIAVRFISKWDFIKHRDRAYYLVQSL